MMIIELEIKDYDELKVITQILLNRIIQEHRPGLTEENILWVISELREDLQCVSIRPKGMFEDPKYTEETIIKLATQMLKHQFYSTYGRDI